MCVGGDAVNFKGDGFEEVLNYGESILVPAKINKLEIISSGYSELLEIYIS